MSCGNDFYNFINNEWLAKTQIPDDYERWCMFTILNEENKKKNN